MTTQRTAIIESAALFLVGAVGLYGGAISYLGMNARMQSSSLKPGMYVMMLGGLLIVTSLVYAIAALRRPSVSPGLVDDDGGGGANGVVALVCASMIAYAVLIPIIGYTLATFLFLVAQFRVLGVESWTRNLFASVTVAALFFVLFVHLAEMTFPRGGWFD